MRPRAIYPSASNRSDLRCLAGDELVLFSFSSSSSSAFRVENEYDTVSDVAAAVEQAKMEGARAYRNLAVIDRSQARPSSASSARRQAAIAARSAIELVYFTETVTDCELTNFAAKTDLVTIARNAVAVRFGHRRL